VAAALMVVAAISFVASPAQAVGTTAGTVISNQAYADYEDANGNPLTRVYSNTVNITVSQVAAVRLEPSTSSKTGGVDSQVYYAATVHNDGNGSDTFDLAASITGTTGTGTAMSTVTIYNDDNGDGMWQSATETTVIIDTGSLDADGVQKVIVVTDIPSGADNGDTGTATLTATSQLDNGQSDSGVYTTSVQAAVVDITKTAELDDANGDSEADPGETLTFTITGTNNGSATAYDILAEDVIPASTTYVTGSLKFGPDGSTYATAFSLTDADDAPDNVAGVRAKYDSGNGKVVFEMDEFPAANVGILFFQVTIDSGTPQGTIIENQLSAAYASTDGGSRDFGGDSNATTTTVGYAPAVDLSATATAQSGDPGDQMVYPFTVTNNGNATDTVDISYNSGAGWTWAFWVDSDGNGVPGTGGDILLTDTDGDSVLDTDDMTAGESVGLLAVAAIPAGTSDGTTDTLTVTGTSSVDTDVSDSQPFTTTVTAPVLSISKSVTPSTDQPPGTELTYTVQVTNSGSGNATSIVVTDAVPSSTTYKADSILTGSSLGSLTARSDASDGDGAHYDGTNKRVVAGSGSSISLGSGGTFYLRFTVTID